MAVLAVLLIVLALVILAASGRAAARRRREEWERQRAERRRVEECGEVVLFFASQLGYIARQAVSRAELSGLIDAGISPAELAAEIGRRMDEIGGITLGCHAFGDCRIEVRLPQEYRDRHIYIIGKSGSGKTNLIRNLIFQDLENGAGIGVLAPEQELLAEEILPYIPDHRMDDVIYFDPADPQCPAFNPLHLEEGEDLDLKVDENLTIFKRAAGETGPRMEEILRQALYALTGRPDATLADLARLLDRTDPAFRSEVIRTSRDPGVVHFWRDVYPVMPKDAHLPVTNRLGRFLHARAVRNVLCKPHRSVSFRKAMDEGKVLLFNLSDGLLGEQNSQLLGQLVISKFQLAAMTRASVSRYERRRFNLYVDEFQTFTGTAAVSYEKLLSRARKYALSLTLAHQQTGQIPAHLLREILGNVSTAICFQVSREDALKLSREMVTEYNGALVTVPPGEILRLRVGQAWCKIGQSAFLMHTPLADQQPNHRRGRSVIERARRNYGLPALPAPAANDDDAVPGTERSAPPGRLQARRAAGALDDLDPGSVFDT